MGIDPITSGKGGGLAPLYAVPGVMASPPVATWKGDGTSTISSPVSYSTASGAFRILNATSQHASLYTQASPSAGMATVYETIVQNADSVDLRFRRNNITMMVFVDDAPISNTIFSTNGDGNEDILQLRFAGTAYEGVPKRIKVIGINILWAGIRISAGGTASAPTVNRPVVAILGDSYTQGIGAPSAGMTFARWCFGALGYDILPEGVGGTGYLTGAGSTAAVTRMTARIGALPAAPSRIALCLGYNDAGGNMTTLAANHAAVVAAANSEWPGVPVATFGPWTPLGETANLLLVRNALAASAGANNSKFIDIANIINSGNAAAYGLSSEAPGYVHPNESGHQYLGEQMALVARAAGLPVAA